MQKFKILSIFGTRPETIKMAPLIKELEQREEISSIVCVTAQHRQMLDQVLDAFKIKPDYDLDIMKQGQTLSEITSRVLSGMDEVLKDIKPDMILVHGDTSTTFSAALSAFYHQIPIGHVEAGLRTYNKFSPFPEEMNRLLTGDLADLHFAPTENAKQALLKENKNPNNIFVTGNTAIDAMKYTIDNNVQLNFLDGFLNENEKLIVLTAHRRENLGEPMRRMFRAIKNVVDKFDDVKVVYPVHLNPLVQNMADEIFGDSSKFLLIKPLEVKEFHNLLAKSHIILTDSGGIQEEAPSLGKPVLVLRDTTERPEGIDAGTLKLVGTSEEYITEVLTDLISNKESYDKMAHAKNPYGDGFASKYIVDHIINYLKNTRS